MSTPAFPSGTGRRKTAVARVRLLPGEGEIVVNGRTLTEHFGNAVSESDLRMGFRVTGTEGRFNAMIKVEGGGVTGQAGAIRHGIARALLELDPEANRLPLRQAEHWCSEVAGLRVHGTTRQLPRAIFEAEEQPKLQPYDGVT